MNTVATIEISDEEESFDFTPPPKVSFENLVNFHNQDNENIVPETIMDGGSKNEQTTFNNSQSQANATLSSLEVTTQIPTAPASKELFSPLSSPGSLFDWFEHEPETTSSAEDDEEEEASKENDTLASQESEISRNGKIRKRKHLSPLKPRKRIRIDDYETDSSSSSHESNISGEDSGQASNSLLSEESSLTEDSNSVSTSSRTESSLSEESNPDSALLSQDSDETIHSSDSEYCPSEWEVWDDESEIPDTQAVALDFEVSDLFNQKNSSFKNRSKGFQKNIGIKIQRNKKTNNRVSKKRKQNVPNRGESSEEKFSQEPPSAAKKQKAARLRRGSSNTTDVSLQAMNQTSASNNSSLIINESLQQQLQPSQLALKSTTTSIVPPTMEDDGFEEVYSLKSILIPIGDGYRLFLDNGKGENGESSYYCSSCKNHGKKTLAKICKLTKKTLVQKIHHEKCYQEYETL